MELRDYVSIVLKRWVSIVALTVIGVVAGVSATLLTAPTYTAVTQVYVSVQGSSTTNDLLQGANFTRQQVASYARLVGTPLVLGPVIDDLGLDMRADDLAQRITAETPPNSAIVSISVSDGSASLAAALANAVADEFRAAVSELDAPTDGSPSNVKLTVVRQAAAPDSPSSPNGKLNVALGLVVGLALGIGAAVLRELLDTRVRDEASVAQVTDASVIGVIAFDEDVDSRPLIVQSDPQSPRAEAFRRLRTNVQFLEVDDRQSSIVVTSSLPGEGKSTTTINLAIALADAGTRVLLVDADLRRPSVAKKLAIEGNVGLTTVLIGRASLADVVQPWGNGNLHVLPSGQIPPNPSELLGSKAMSAVLDQALGLYDIVLLDTPPLLPVTDAAILGRMSGGVLLVVGAGKVHRNQLAEALGALDAVDAHVLGVVVNREPRKQSSAYQYYEYTSDGPGGQSARRTTSLRGRTAPRRGGTADAAPVTPAGGGHTAALWPGESMSEATLRERRGLSPQHQRGSK